MRGEVRSRDKSLWWDGMLAVLAQMLAVVVATAATLIADVGAVRSALGGLEELNIAVSMVLLAPLSWGAWACASWSRGLGMRWCAMGLAVGLSALATGALVWVAACNGGERAWYAGLLVLGAMGLAGWSATALGRKLLKAPGKRRLQGRALAALAVFPVAVGLPAAGALVAWLALGEAVGLRALVLPGVWLGAVLLPVIGARVSRSVLPWGPIERR